MDNTYEYIIVAATHAKLVRVRDAFAVEDQQKTLRCKFEFRTDDWEGATKTAVFQKQLKKCEVGTTTPVHVILGDDCECDVPAEVLEEDGIFNIGVFGLRNGEEVLPTNFVSFKVHEGCYGEGDEPAPPSQSVYEQIIAELAKKQNTLTAGNGISIENGVISLAGGENLGLVVNAATHLDFPSVGDANIIYKAEKERQIYQWDSEELKYVALGDTETLSINVINGGSASGQTT